MNINSTSNASVYANNSMKEKQYTCYVPKYKNMRISVTPSKEAQTSLLELPENALINIDKDLSLRDIFAIRKTCRSVLDIIDNNEVTIDKK